MYNNKKDNYLVVCLIVEGFPSMQAVETIKKSRLAYVANGLEKGQGEPAVIKTWGITAGGALVGAATVAASAPRLLALATFLATPPLALTVGALGGAVLGWRYMRERRGTRTPPGSPAHRPSPGRDDLELINGITPTYADRLRAAGINTFAQLAELLPERVHLIIGPTDDGNIIQSEHWIAEARRRAI